VANPAAPKGSVESYGNTQTQTVAALKKIAQALEAQKLTLADVIMMHVYLVGDPAKEGKMDFSGFMAGYSQFFEPRNSPTSLPAAPCRWLDWLPREPWWKLK